MIAPGNPVELIGHIYDAALEPRLWPEVLAHFADLVGGAQTMFLVQDVASQHGSLHPAVRFDPAWQHAYETHYADQNIFMIRGEQKQLYRQGRVLTGEMVCSDAELLSCEYYNDYLRPQNMFRTFGGVVLRNQNVTSLIVSMRSKNAPPFGAPEIVTLKMLMPHLQRALQIHLRFAALELQGAAGAGTLDRLHMGVILLSKEGGVSFVNRAAQEVIDSHDGLGITRAGLVAGTSRETTALRSMLQRAGSATTGQAWDDSGGVLRLSRPSGRRELALIVTPLTIRNRFIFGVVGAVIAVFVSDPERPTVVTAEHLRRLYRLTPTEAALAALLASGLNLQEVCDRLSISKNTGRWHLKRVFSKTATKSQSDLVRLLVGGPAALKST